MFPSLARVAVSASVLFGLSMLTACTAEAGRVSQSTSSSSQSVDSSSTRNRTFQSATALRDAAVAAGFSCPSWRPVPVLGASSAGDCSDRDTFSVYSDHAALDENVTYLRSQVIPATLLMGPNWLINSSDAPNLQGVLGGEIVSVGPPSTPTDSTPPASPSPESNFGAWTTPSDGISVKLSTPQRQPDNGGLCSQDAVMQLQIRNTGHKSRELRWIEVQGLDESESMFVEGGAGLEIYDDASISPGETQTWKVTTCSEPAEPVGVKIQIIYDSTAEFRFSE
jgi:hypothetical protein